MQTASIHCRICEPDCTVCNKPCNADGMCPECDVTRLRGQFPKWTSGSKEIDAIIQETQETARRYVDYWEWIESKQFKDIKHLADGVYTATWLDGYRTVNHLNNRRTRIKSGIVVLKVPNVPHWSADIITSEFLNEVSVIIRENLYVTQCDRLIHHTIQKCNYVTSFLGL